MTGQIRKLQSEASKKDICPFCVKSSRPECEMCGGLKRLRVYKGIRLYWGRRLTVWHVAYDRMVNRGKILWIMVLLAASFFGKAELIHYLWQTTFSPTTLLFSGIVSDVRDIRILLGWASFGIDLYVYYFLSVFLDIRKSIQVVLKGEHKESTPPIDIALYTSRSTLEAIEAGWKLADKYEQKELLPLHIFCALLDTPPVKMLFGRLGTDYQTLSEKLAHQLARHKSPEKAEVMVGQETRDVLIEAFIHSEQNNKRTVDEMSLLSAIAKHDVLVQELLYDLAIDADKLMNAIHWIDIRQDIIGRFRQFRKRASLKPKGSMDRAMTALSTPFLDRYSIDLTHLAASGHLELIVGRNTAFLQLFRALESGAYGVVFVGPPGVGKTSLLYGLAQRMAEERVPKLLQDKRLVNLDAARIVSGATASAAAERLLKIADEISKAGNIILAIENIHLLFGISAGSEESFDLIDVVSSIITKRSFPIVATSEPLDYSRQTMQTTLGQIFRVIRIDEPEHNLAIQIIESKTLLLEHKHKVFFTYDAISELIKLSYRYLPDEFMPAKAIRLLEEIAIAKSNESEDNDRIIRVSDVAEIVSEKTRIPVSQVSKKETEVLLQLEHLIHERLIDQEEAVTAVSEALRRARTELSSEKRPIANFLFLGPTGVGKTQLAKTVAEVYFGDEKNMIRLDMSEYQDASAVSRLLGSEGGSGSLTRELKKKPFSIVLLDEIEKASVDILNLFLQIMDDGRITDGSGRVIDCTNIILIATSNAGSQFIQDALAKKESIQSITNELMEGELKQYFKPEFLNRFDGIIVFKPLSKKDIGDIAKLMIADLSSRLKEKRGVTLVVDQDMVEDLVKAGYEPAFGARPMRRAIQDRLDTPIATLLLKGNVARRDTIQYTKGEMRVLKGEVL